MEAMKATKGVGRRSGEERNKSVSKLVKTGLQFPVSCIARFLKKGRYAQRTGTSLQFPVGRIAHFLVTHIARFLQFPFCF